MRVAVTGASGRLGTALRAALRERPLVEALFAWDLPEHDLDDPRSAGRLVERDRPDVVVHTAAFTDVDGCARDPDVADRRNAEAVGDLARATAAIGAGLVYVSTNEVFDGRRADGRGYGPADEPHPINPYGASKLAGERAARAAYERAPERLAIVRTAWLFGPGAPDFPTKILAAARDAASAGRPLRVVGDEWGSPTYVVDLAAAIAGLLESGGYAGTHHIVNAEVASRADWARDVVRLAGLEAELVEVPASTWSRASTPPRWAVLAPTPLPGGERLRPWREAMMDYAPILLGHAP